MLMIWSHLQKRNQQKKATFKDGGVKKLVIIGIVQEIAETYYNTKTILNLLNIEKIDFVIATDYKLCNILLGLSSHSSKYKCPYCKVPSDQFCNHRREVLPSDLRTLGDIREWHCKFKLHCEQNYPEDPRKAKKMPWIFTTVLRNPCSIYLTILIFGIFCPYLSCTYALVSSTGKAIF